jgi:MFS family permease
VLTTGVAFLAQTLVLGALSLGPTARLVQRYGPRPVLAAGLVLATAGLALFAQIGLHTAYAPQLVGAMVLIGAGAGLSFMPLLTIAMAEVPRADAGMASGIVNTSLQISAAIGVAVLGTLSSEHTRSLLASGAARTPALLDGYRLAFTVGAGCVAAALVTALVWCALPRVRQVVGTPSPSAP